MSVDDKYYLAFNDGENTSLLCDVNTGKGIRCTHEGGVDIQFGANCSAPITFKNLENVDYPDKLDAAISNAYCTLDGEDMEMMLRLEFGDYVASSHERLIRVNSESLLLLPEWEVTEQ